MDTPHACAVSGCLASAFARGFCQSHYRRLRLYGNPIGGHRFKPQGQCSVTGCAKLAKRMGLCVAHHHRWLRHGSPTGGRPTMHGDPFAWLREHCTDATDDCTEWPFARLSDGYGSIQYAGRTHSAAHVMCILAHGEPPTPEHEVAHGCGCGPSGCVSPRHLRWATRAENQADRLIHDTSPRGENCGTSVLSEADVRELRRLQGHLTLAELSAQYGVSRSTISAIHVGRTWSWLT